MSVQQEVDENEAPYIVTNNRAPIKYNKNVTQSDFTYLTFRLYNILNYIIFVFRTA